jgi:hypothetical protein
MSFSISPKWTVNEKECYIEFPATRNQSRIRIEVKNKEGHKITGPTTLKRFAERLNTTQAESHAVKSLQGEKVFNLTTAMGTEYELKKVADEKAETVFSKVTGMLKPHKTKTESRSPPPQKPKTPPPLPSKRTSENRSPRAQEKTSEMQKSKPLPPPPPTPSKKRKTVEIKDEDAATEKMWRDLDETGETTL